jgi:probable rRNA maturation factor
VSVSDENEPVESGGWKIDVVDRTGECAVAVERLSELAERVLRDERVEEAEVGVAIVDDLEMTRLHVQFLQIDGPTDVLTFPLHGDSLETWSGPLEALRGADRRIGGEVVIGGDTARRVAGELGTEVSEEVILYLVHGLLHLCGYDDRDELQRQQMRRREAEVLSLLEVAVRVER